MEKENEKITKYQELAVKMNKVLHTRTKVTLIVIGVLGAKYQLRDNLVALLGVQIYRVDNIKQVALLGS